MSELSNKYNIPEEAVKKMIKDGVISCSWEGYSEVYAMYKELRNSSGKCKSEIAYEISDRTHQSQRNVLYIISKFE